MTATITVDNEEPLVDDVITIKVKGLKKNQPITVRAEVTEGQVFAGSACFTADDNGEVDLSQDASVSGTYTGVSSMGLFWSMRSTPSMPSGIRLLKKNASSALIVHLTALPGLLTFEEIYSSPVHHLCNKQIRRWYMANGVQKVKVRTGRLRGTLFLPPGKGPFPGVIDMFGTTGSCIEIRAALLASRGFASLALPYFMYDDLPKNIEGVEFEYFLEAVNWFAKQPSVDADNLGAIGVSKGGEIALHLGYYCDKIKSVVSINGAPFFTKAPMLYKGDYIGQSITKPDEAIITDEGMDVTRALDCEIENYLSVWEKDVKVLVISGLDDRCLNPKIHSNFYNCYPQNRRHLCQLRQYPGSGHLIEPPYAPLTRSTTIYNRGDQAILTLLWGGQTVEHALAQEDSWKRILHHFHSTLTSSPVKDTCDTSDVLNSKL